MPPSAARARASNWSTVRLARCSAWAMPSISLRQTAGSLCASAWAAWARMPASGVRSSCATLPANSRCACRLCCTRASKPSRATPRRCTSLVLACCVSVGGRGCRSAASRWSMASCSAPSGCRSRSMPRSSHDPSTTSSHSWARPEYTSNRRSSCVRSAVVCAMTTVNDGGPAICKVARRISRPSCERCENAWLLPAATTPGARCESPAMKLPSAAYTANHTVSLWSKRSRPTSRGVRSSCSGVPGGSAAWPPRTWAASAWASSSKARSNASATKWLPTPSTTVLPSPQISTSDSSTRRPMRWRRSGGCGCSGAVPGSGLANVIL